MRLGTDVPVDDGRSLAGARHDLRTLGAHLMTAADSVLTGLISRRHAILLPVILGAAGCAQPAEMDDPYIRVMKNDPMYSWSPSMDVKRYVSILPRDASFEPGPYSVIDIWLTPRDPTLVPGLLAAAEQARSDAGYSERDRRHVGKVDSFETWIGCRLTRTTRSPNIPQSSGESDPIALHIALHAPYLEP